MKSEMVNSLRHIPAASGVVAGLTCLMASAHATDGCAIQLRLIDRYVVSPETRVDGDLVGGISGLDYDARTRQWYLVSDDRSEHAPARFFVAEMRFNSREVAGVYLRASQRLKVTAQSSTSFSPDEIIDAESLRVDPRNGELLIASEGDTGKSTGPWIRRTDRNGQWLGEVRLPPTLVTAALPQPLGPRSNRSIEGLSFTPLAHALWISLETPLEQDGQPASTLSGADVRLTRLDWPNGTVSQYVYATEAAHAHAAGESSDNGISEILALTERELLVLERSGIRGIDGQFRFHTRLYCADTNGATDVASLGSLAGEAYQKSGKELLVDFDNVDAGNLEAMSWGPRLKNGRRSLVLASDNNFFNGVATQLLFFEVRQ
jgi:hypothetical protein